MNKLISLILISFFLFGCTQIINSVNEEQNNNGEILQLNPLKVELLTEDNVKIIGFMHQAKSNKGIILLHQMNSTKESYSDLAKELNAKNFTVLAIDFRGHGESITKNNEKYLWVDFSSQDFLLMQKDIESAYNYLNSIGVTEIYLIGSSLGANNALNFALKNDVKAVALLSPSLDYKGITTFPSAETISVPVFIACSKEDYSFNDCNKLSELIKSEKEIQFIHGTKHGIFILEDEFVKRDLIEWISQDFNSIPEQGLNAESFCEKDLDCECGTHVISGECFYGNKVYVNSEKQCPDFCTGIAGNFEIKCIENTCVQQKI
ncbi:MAG: alpha/beta fold hydrolase [Candidatus Diapherotrites archaeon]|nr:alpha/beta fold hydrolase [Candidatus Diapherotrites archaeon]